MTKAEVIAKIGRPDGSKMVSGAEILSYNKRLITGWAWDRANYHVVLQDGKVTESGEGEVKPKEDGTVVIVPQKTF
jgi:hypothetical protein